MPFNFVSVTTKTFSNNVNEMLYTDNSMPNYERPSDNTILFQVYGWDDINTGGVTEGADGSEVDNHSFNFAIGYYPTDMKGYIFADASGLSIVYTNSGSFVGAIRTYEP